MLVSFITDEHYAFSKFMKVWDTRNVISNCSRQHYIRKKIVSATILFIDGNERVLLMTNAFGYFGLIQSNIRTSSI